MAEANTTESAHADGEITRQRTRDKGRLSVDRGGDTGRHSLGVAFVLPRRLSGAVMLPSQEAVSGTYVGIRTWVRRLLMSLVIEKAVGASDVGRVPVC